MTAQPPAETTATSAQRIGWAVLIFVTLYICYFSHLGVIGFVGPDEPRYAWIARDMAETGDWVTPRLYGKPWFEKPPLLYWGGAVFFKLFGDRAPESAARLPSAISALLATLALAWLAWRTYGEECARWLLLLLPTSVGMIGFSHAAATDMPFAGMLTIAMVCAAVVLGLARNENTPVLPHTPWLALLLFGFFLGLAVLAKGPAGIILVGGAIFFWAIFTRRWRDAFRLLHPAAIAAFCVTALPWYILCARRNPDFFRIFIIEHNFKRYLTPEFQHIQPFWFYIPIVLIALLPWAPLLVWQVGRELRFTREVVKADATVIFLASWPLVTIAFFTVSKSKLPGYVLPAIFPLILLETRTLHSLLRRESREATIVLSCLAITIITLVFGAARYSVRVQLAFSGIEYREQTALVVLRIASYLLCLTAVALMILRRKTIGTIFAVTGLVMSLWSAMVTILPSLDRVMSTRHGSERVIETRNQNEQISLCNLPRAYIYGFSFYLHREALDWDQRTPQTSAVVVLGPNCADEIRNEGYRLKRQIELVPFEIVEVQPPSLNRPSGGRQPQQKE